MSINVIGMVSFWFLGLTLINRVIAGTFSSGEEFAVINALTVFKEVSVFNLFTLPVPNLEFITVGLPRLVTWDYSFFGGYAQIILYFLYSISAAVAFGLFILVLGLLYNYFGRAGR